MSGLTPEADIPRWTFDVRFVPIAAVSQPLLDHPVGAAEQRQRYVDAERLCGLEVDDHLDLGNLLHRKVGGLVALENAAHVDAGQSPGIGRTGTVAHQAAGRSELRRLK